MTERLAQETVVEFDRVTLRFETRAVLREISFALQRGETKIVLGAAGSGKFGAAPTGLLVEARVPERTFFFLFFPMFFS